ncbi:MAG: hypothetical protein JWN87_2057, partial [Frankiales bacterium]|nr:hypothetical protein [Frankiales bacterium]
MKRLLVLLLPVLLLVLGLPGTASAENAAQVAAALRNSPVYQSPGVDLVDVTALSSQLSGTDPPVKVAVLSAAAAASSTQAAQLATTIVRDLGDRNAVVLVITANRHLGAAAGPDARSRGVDAATALREELAAQGSIGFTKTNITAFVTAFAQRVAAQASGSGAAAGSGSVPAQRSGSSGSSHAGAYFLGGLLVLGGGATALAVRSSRNRRNKLNEGLRADVEQLYNRLGSDVMTLDPGEDRVARQALADASERYNATGATLATADSPPEFAAARRSAIEGLTATQSARRALGLDPGPEVPALGGGGPHLSDDQRVRVGEQEYEGSPDYRPGRGHYFEGGNVGGQMVPGGWYSAPFWTPFLLGGLLTGGFGGGGLFGG